MASTARRPILLAAIAIIVAALRPIAAFDPYLPPNTDRGAIPRDDETNGDGDAAIPPASDPSNNEDDDDESDFFDAQFGDNADRMVPPRLRGSNGMARDTVATVNDWHFAMMNDAQRNDAFARALRLAIGRNRRAVVVDIGAGSGLLSLMAARLGAKRVYAVEGNPDLSALARRLAQANGLDGIVDVITGLSDALPNATIPAPGADVVVAELLGTLLLGESALYYMGDVRDRFLAPGGRMIPASGAQHGTLISSEQLDAVVRIPGAGRAAAGGAAWGGLDLDGFNLLRDTVTTRFTKQLGFRMSDVGYTALSPLLELFRVDFARNTVDDVPRNVAVEFVALASGRVDALMLTWEIDLDAAGTITVSTHPDRTKDNFNRDMMWGQALIFLVDDGEENDDGWVEAEGAKTRVPRPVVVSAGMRYRLHFEHVAEFWTIRARLEEVAASAAEEAGDDEGREDTTCDDDAD